jgi:hypothetical protein
MHFQPPTNQRQHILIKRERNEFQRTKVKRKPTEGRKKEKEKEIDCTKPHFPSLYNVIFRTRKRAYQISKRTKFFLPKMPKRKHTHKHKHDNMRYESLTISLVA